MGFSLLPVLVHVDSTENVGITQKTQARYYLAVSRFFAVIEKCRTVEDIDDAVADWVETVHVSFWGSTQYRAWLTGLVGFINI